MRFELDRNFPQTGHIWQHYKGGRYEIVGGALHEDNGEWMVIYKTSPATDGRWFVRAYDDFMSTAPHYVMVGCPPGGVPDVSGFRFTRLLAEREDDGRKA